MTGEQGDHWPIVKWAAGEEKVFGKGWGVFSLCRSIILEMNIFEKDRWAVNKA